MQKPISKDKPSVRLNNGKSGKKVYHSSSNLLELSEISSHRPNEKSPLSHGYNAKPSDDKSNKKRRAKADSKMHSTQHELSIRLLNSPTASNRQGESRNREKDDCKVMWKKNVSLSNKILKEIMDFSASKQKKDRPKTNRPIENEEDSESYIAKGRAKANTQLEKGDIRKNKGQKLVL